jgi:CheY-like chemotaxis protein
VRDTGIGIPNEKIKKIFDAFSQADESSNREYGGTGLGLAISNLLVMQMGGSQIEIKSDIGRGSEFSFKIPLTIPNYDIFDKPFMKDKKINLILPANKTPKRYHSFLRLYLEYGDAIFKFISPEEIISSRKMSTPDIYILDDSVKYKKDLLDIIANSPSKNVLIANKGQDEAPVWIDWVLEQPITYPEVLEMSNKILSNKRTSDKKKIEKKRELSLKDMKILLAEDNPVNRKLAEALLRRMGPQIDMVENGKDAYKKRVSNSYHIILMDIEMPILNGIEATEKILEYEKRSQKEHIPIIALTANTLEETRQKYPNFNMDGLLSKPIKAPELKKTLDSILKSHRDDGDDKNKGDKKELKKRERKRELSLKDMKILLAEDNPVNRKLAEALLRRMGPQVDMVENGKDAYKKRVSNSYHIILMDIEMPILDGIEATEKILEYEKRSQKEHIPIIALTANTLEETRQKYPNFNMDGLLSKPIKAPELEKTLNNILKSHQDDGGDKNKGDKNGYSGDSRERELQSSSESDGLDDRLDEEISLKDIIDMSEEIEESDSSEKERLKKNIIVVSRDMNITRACSISFGRLGVLIKHFTMPPQPEELDPKHDIVLIQNRLMDKSTQGGYIKILRQYRITSYVIVENSSYLDTFGGREFVKGVELTEIEIGDASLKILRDEI